MSEKYRIKLKDGLLTGVNTKEREKLAKTSKNVDILRELANSKSVEVRKYVAENPNTPINILKELANDKDSNVLRYLAYNTNTPTDILINLYKEEYAHPGIASNPNTPVDILEELAKNNHWSIRRYVTLNPNCPLDILKQLSDDKDEDVRRYARNHPTFKKYIKSLNLSELDELKYISAEESIGLAETTKDVNILRELAKHENLATRANVAKNPSTPGDILKQLANEEDFWILEGLAFNPNTPIGILKQLAEHKNRYVREEVAKNPNCPESILRQLAEDNNYDVLKGVAQNPNIPLNLIKQLIEDGDWDVCEEILKNSKVPNDFLIELARDKSVYGYTRRHIKQGLKKYRNIDLSNPKNRANAELSSLTPSQVRNRIFKGSQASRVEALKYALDNIDNFDEDLFKVVYELDLPYLDEVLRNHPNTPEDILNALEEE